MQSRAKYLSVAKQMKSYEDHLYDQWREQVEGILPSLLKRNLLIKPHERQTTNLEQEGNPEVEGKYI